MTKLTGVWAADQGLTGPFGAGSPGLTAGPREWRWKALNSKGEMSREPGDRETGRGER